MEKTGSIKAIAENAGLSRGTVSLILNGRGDEMRIAKDTQARVVEEARKLGYKPNIHARRLRQKSSNKETAIIGILWASLYTAELLIRFFDGMQKTLLEDGMDVEVVYKPFVYNEINKISSVFKNSLYNGVIVVGASDSDIEHIKIANYIMPVVLFNRQDEDFSSVCLDYCASGSKAAELFYARGHKTVGIIGSNLLMRHQVIRQNGFIETCKKLGVDLPADNIVNAGLSVSDGELAASALLKSKSRPSALFLSLSSIAPGVYSVFEKSGISIPDDIEILGYADNAFSQFIKPTLSVIDLPIQEMVKKCMKIILDTIAGDLRQPLMIYEKNQLIIRESFQPEAGDDTR